jgi:hypothetical protein
MKKKAKCQDKDLLMELLQQACVDSIVEKHETFNTFRLKTGTAHNNLIPADSAMAIPSATSLTLEDLIQSKTILERLSPNVFTQY